MIRNLSQGLWKQFLICLLFLPCIGSNAVYAFNHAPFIIAVLEPTASNFYTADPQSACEHAINTLRLTQPYAVPGPEDADILSIEAIPTDQNGSPISSGPASFYRCTAKILRFLDPPVVLDINASFVNQTCNVGGPSNGSITNETICNAPDNESDPGANQGGPGGECPGKKFVSNPINAATGDKFAQETDIALVSGLVFSRSYNSNSLSGSSQIGTTWRHTYQLSLYVNPETVTATRADGRLAYFYLTGGTWVNQQAGGDTLTQLTDTNGDPTGWEFKTANDTTETYDVAGQLQTIADRDGRIQTLNYDTNGNLASVSDDTGRTLTFTVDGSARIDTMTDPGGGLYQYAYDTDGNLASVTYPDNTVRTYHHNEQAYTNNTDLPNALTGITDEKGVRYATYTYDTEGRAFITEHAGGADRHILAYSTGSTTITDPLVSDYTLQFQSILGVTKTISQSQPAGSGCSAASSATTYDANGNVASRTDFNGNKTCFAYDLNRNLETARVEGLAAATACPTDLVNYVPVNNDERKTLTTWDTNFRLPTIITEAQRETTLSYDTYGNATSLSIRDTSTNDTRTWNTSYTYHATVPGVMVQRIEDGPRTDVTDTTTIDYYAPDASCTGGHLGCRGQISTITNALGHATQITRYNAHGQPEIMTDPNGLTTTLTYDARQRLVSRVVGTETTAYQYDNVGQVTRITFPDNSFLNYTYDDAQRLVGIADSLNNHIQYTLDAMGNRTKEDVYDPSNTLTQTRQQEFDALSRLWKNIGAQSQTTELAYDANGNLKQATNPLQHSTTAGFDALDRLIQSTDPLNGQAQQTQDKLDQVTQVTDPKGIVTTYTYNGLGDLLQEVSADRGITTYTYDAAGNQLTKTDARGVVETTAYDALNRQTSRVYTTVTGVPNIEPITWNYDAGSNGVGRLSSMSDESGTTTYNYDLHGRLLSKIQVVKFGTKTFTQTLSYQYDSSGRLSQTTYPSGTVIDTVYGADGRPIELKVNGNTLIQNITYQPFGAVKSWTWGNGQIHSRSFDLDGRVSQHPLGSDTRTLTYDVASQITATVDTNPVYNRNYSYDELGRVISQVTNTSTRQWTYDANSNRTGLQSGSTVYPYTIDANSNRLMSIAGPVAETYTYDATGNVISDGIINFTWNAAGRLRKIVKGTKKRHYKYNGFGERIRRQGWGSRRFAFIYDGAGQMISQSMTENINQGNWVLEQETIWLDNTPIAVLKKPVATDPAQVYFVHADHLNSPRLIVDQTNTPVWRWENNQAFGDNLADNDPDGDGTDFVYDLRFAGQYFDSETRLHYNYFRSYDPETGRYISSDPIGLAGGLNTYGYVGGNPLSLIDPLGLSAFLFMTDSAAAFEQQALVLGNDPSTREGASATAAHISQAALAEFGLLSSIPFTPTAGVKIFSGIHRAISRFCPVTNNVPAKIFRGGGKNPGSLTPRPKDGGFLSARDSLSNPISKRRKPPLASGEPIQVIDTSKLPPGSVRVDGGIGGRAPGHVSIGPNVPAQTIKDAIVETIPRSVTK